MLHRGCLRDSPLNLLRRPASGKIPWCRHDLRLEEVTVPCGSGGRDAQKLRRVLLPFFLSYCYLIRLCALSLWYVVALGVTLC